MRLTFVHRTPKTVHIMRNGTRLGSLRRGGFGRGSWFGDQHVSAPDFTPQEQHAIGQLCLHLHDKYSTPERIAAFRQM